MTIYFKLLHAVQIHHNIIQVSGGFPGVKDEGALDSILTHIQNDDYYPAFELKLTHLVYAVNKGHCFHDGNKRASIGMGALFLEINGLASLVDKFIIEMENIAVAVADDIIDKYFLEEIITSILIEDEFNEGLKIKIMNALKEAVDTGSAYEDSELG